MNLFLSLVPVLQAAGGGAPAAGGAQGGGAGWSMWIMLILVGVVMYFTMIRPQRQQQKKQEEFRKSLKKGDKVVTIGGLYGVVDEINENDSFAFIRVDKDVKIKVAKASLQSDFSETPQS